MKRHIDAWLEGEDYAEDSGAHHLGHIGANAHVALAAIAAGSFVDDRGCVGGEGRLDQRPGQGCRVTCVAHPDRPVHAHGMCRRCYDGRKAAGNGPAAR
jgi:hypothetical protein